MVTLPLTALLQCSKINNLLTVVKANIPRKT